VTRDHCLNNLPRSASSREQDVTGFVAALKTVRPLPPHLFPLARPVLIAARISSTNAIPTISFASAVALVATALVGQKGLQPDSSAGRSSYTWERPLPILRQGTNAIL